MMLNNYVEKWILWTLPLLGIIVSFLGGLLVYAGYLDFLRLITGVLILGGGGMAVWGYYRMISSGPKVRLLTLFYLIKELAIGIVGIRLVLAAIGDLGFQSPNSLEVIISYSLITLAAFFIFSSGLYTLLGTVFDVFQLQVYKNPFKQRQKQRKDA